MPIVLNVFFQNPVNTRRMCPGPSESITQYQIRFQSGSLVDAFNVNISACTAGMCSHTFELPSNPPSSYDSVSVVAENVVGVGAAKTCIEAISELVSCEACVSQFIWSCFMPI